MATQKCNWPIGNNEALEFDVYPTNEGWNPVPGLYIFSYVSEGRWIPLYVGQAENFQTRMPNHDRLDEAVRNGATHIHAKVCSQQAFRDRWEQLLIQHLQPPMNIHYR